MAWAQPHQYVSGRRHLLSAFGQAQAGAALPFPLGDFGRGCHHCRGAADWSAGQPGFPGVGLPADALSVYGPDLPELQPAVDSRKSGCYGAAPAVGNENEEGIGTLLI